MRSKTAATIQAFLSSDRNTVANAAYELTTTDLRPELGHIGASIEVVYAYDSLYGVSATRIDALFHSANGALSHACFRRIDESFHFIMLDQPDLFVRAVLDFLGPNPSEGSPLR